MLHQHALRQSTQPVAIAEALNELRLASDDDPTASVDTQQRLDALHRSLALLPPKLATTLLLHRYAGHSIEEIARHLGVSRGTAKNYLAKALLFCRDQRKDKEPS